jgi:hypothetical protein
MIGRYPCVIDLRNLAVRSAGSLERVTDDFVERGWLSRSNEAWRVGPIQMPPGLPSFLEGAAAMRATMPDDGRATVVVTMPTAPSAIRPTLAGTGLAHAALVATEEIFERVAGFAVTSLTIMTPFLNDDGLIVVLTSFAAHAHRGGI